MPMEKIYLDNSSTSFPKAIGVGDVVKNFIDNSSCNISRGGYGMAYDLEGLIYDTRDMLCKMFNFHKPSNVCFTPSVTYALNFLISGLLKKGDHVVISGMEHNAVSRPIKNLEKYGVNNTIVKCDKEGFLDLDELEKSINVNTKAVIICFVSNVSGTIQDIESISKICSMKNVPLILDASQGAGVIDIDFKKLNLSALAMPAHKGLLAPQGLGILMITDELNEKVDPIILGGTGSISDKLVMPNFLPDKFEAGTLNLPGIVGLNKALEFINKVGIDTIREKEKALTYKFINGLKDIKGISIIGPKDINKRAGVVSIDFIDKDNSDMAFRLDDEYKIMTRCGLHCAPLAHMSYETFPKGTVRFSFGYFNTEDEVEKVVEAISNLID